LLEKGYISAGQELYFGDHKAVVLPNGHLRCGGYSGSIHKVGSELRKAPCNGWMAWYYHNQKTGKREPIDVLRQQARSQIEADVNLNTSEAL